MSRSPIRILKASGDYAPFSEGKLRSSLVRSGASQSQIDLVVKALDDYLYDGISTKKIYRKAYDILRRRSRGNAARYKLKKAIMELGPSGYPFERFVGAILEQQGCRTRIGVTVPGRCVRHEIDVLASKNGKLIMVECKFHNRPGVKCDVKVPLYIHSRFQDVSDADKINRNPDGFRGEIQNRTQNVGLEIDIKEMLQTSEFEGWIVTNTRFTEDAIQFGNCRGLVMLGWDYPDKGNLRELIGLSGLHPVTCLSSLKHKEKKLLMERGVVLCREIVSDTAILQDIGIIQNRAAKVIDECNELVEILEVPED